MDTTLNDDVIAAASPDRAANPDTVSLTVTRLTRLWAEILECDHIGPDDNFFLLGGDSLRAAALFAEIEASFGVTLPLETVFDEGETVTGMALLIDRALAGRTDASGADAGTPVSETVPPRQAPLFAPGDGMTALTLFALATLAWLPRRRALPAVCRRLAEAHIALRGSQAGDLACALEHIERRISARDIEIGVVAGGYEDIAEALRDYAPRLRQPTVRLIGRRHLETALAAGHGAVLWNFAARRGSRAAAGVLKKAGAPVVQLRSAIHPLSGSRFGTAVLNPIINRIDNRNLAASVMVDDKSVAGALKELGDHLRENRVIRLSAHGAGDAPHEIPFFGGTLRLALGAPTLALQHRAPLLPVFTLPNRVGGFDVFLEAPLAIEETGTAADRARRLAEAYAGRLGRYVSRYPHLWRGWFMRNTWRPGARGNVGNG